MKQKLLFQLISKFTIKTLLLGGALVTFSGFDPATSVVWGQTQRSVAKVEESAKTVYQGQLKEDGVSASGIYDFQFNLYTDAREGTSLAQLVRDNIGVKEGAFQVSLDLKRAAVPVREGWLEIAVRKSGSAEGYVILTPRQQINFQASTNEGDFNSKAGFTPTVIQDSSGWTRDGRVLSLTSDTDNVGIGTKTPKAKLDVEGDVHASGPIKTGNSLSLDGVLHTFTATTTSNPATSKQIYIGLDPSSGPNFFDIGVGIGTKSLGGSRLKVYNPNTPNILLSSDNVSGGTVKANLEFGIATCPSCFSSIATPGDVVIRGDADATEDVIIAARSWTTNPLAGAIRFTTGDQTNTATGEKERMTILKNGFVGVGNNAPPSLFAVGNSNQFRVDAGGDIVRIKNVPYSWPASQATAANQVLTNNGSGGLSWATAGGNVSGSCASTNFVTKWASLNGITCSQIFDNGTNVGIGTTLPQSKLSIGGSGTNLSQVYISKSGTFPTRALTVEYDNNTGIFINPLSGGTGMALNANGRGRFAGLCVGSGVNCTDFNYNPGANNLHVEGTVRVDTLGALTTTPVCWNATTHILSACSGSSSDARLKANVTPLNHTLDKLARIRGVSFTWNETGRQFGALNGRREIGVLAQEVEAVFPELVTDLPEGYKAVDYDKMTAVLIEAVKELKAENESLKQRILDIEKKVAKQK